MRHSTLKLLSVTTIALLSPFVPLDALPIPSSPAFAQTDPAARLAEADRLFDLGIEQANISQFQSALQSWQQALELYRDPSVRAAFPQESQQRENLVLGAYQNLALDFLDLERYELAIIASEGLLTIGQNLEIQGLQWSALNILGHSYNSLGRYHESIAFHYQALDIALELEEVMAKGVTLAGLGNAYQNLGSYAQAIGYHRQSLEAAREVNNREWEGIALDGLGNAFYSLGQYHEAIEFHEQALDIHDAINDLNGKGRVLNNLGVVYHDLGQYSQAIYFFEQAFDIARERSDELGEVNALGNLGNAYANLNQYHEANIFYEQQRETAREIGARRQEGNALGGLAYVALMQEDYREAIDLYEQRLAIAREIVDQRGEGNALNNLGLAYYNLEQFSVSSDVLLEAIAVYESLRAADLPDAEKISFFDTYLGTYFSLQRSLIAQNDIEQALAYAEQGRARALVDSLATRLASNGDPDAPLLGSISTPTLAEIKQIAAEQNATLVKYSVIFNEALYIWVIQPNSNIAFHSIPLDEASQGQLAGAVDVALSGEGVSRGEESALTNLVANIRPGSRSATRDFDFEYNPELDVERLRELHQLLIEPIQEYLPPNETDRIVFIPQGGLFLVPFAALQDEEGNYLIEKHTISIAPSIQVLDLTRQQRQQANSSASSQDVLIVGDPEMPSIWNVETGTREQLNELPGAKAEAEAIADLFETEAILGSAATETSIADLMPNARIIHLATHGLLEYGIPQDSGVLDVPGAIALAPSESDDGLLTSAELLELNLNAELVVLSACDTGRGRITGDGVIGLSRSLFSAGVPSVVVSLWSVPDAPTADLMTEFYRQLETTPDKAQALRQAMLITMQDHPNPIDWAGFTLIGEAE